MIMLSAWYPLFKKWAKWGYFHPVAPLTVGLTLGACAGELSALPATENSRRDEETHDIVDERAV